MFLYTALFVALRTFVQLVCDDYASKSTDCKSLVNKALAESLPDIRSAYFLKVMEADNKAIAETFETYYISFLASNTTYASEEQIIERACKMPYVTLEFLGWTSGVLSLFGVFVCYRFAVAIWKRCKPRPMAVVEIEEVEEIEMVGPPKDTPPRTPLYVPLTVVHEKPKHLGIRRRQGRSREREPPGPSVMEKLSALSPSLKNRIMQVEEPMV